MARLQIGLVALALLATWGAWSGAIAADRSIPRHAYREYDASAPSFIYVYHRDLRQTYGTGFDARNYDETEPHYYFGPVRRYIRYCRPWECQYQSQY